MGRGTKHFRQRSVASYDLIAVFISIMLVCALQAESYAKSQVPAKPASGQPGSQSIRIGDLSVVDGAEPKSSDADLFGLEGGYFHPYLNVTGEFTDNLYNVNSDLVLTETVLPSGDVLVESSLDNPEGEKIGNVSNFLTRITPGFWFSIPSAKQVPVLIDSTNTTPGGTRSLLEGYKGSGRYFAYGLLQGEYRNYSADSELDSMNGLAEGLFRYNLRGGLSLQVLDRFMYDQDQLEIGAIYRDNLRRFTSNIFVATADYEISEKIRTKFDYSDFFLDYDSEINSIFSRNDTSFDLSAYYKYSLKTSFFIEGKYINVIYDVAEEKDNNQYFIFGGLLWDTTQKISFKGRAGYQQRNYINSFDEFNNYDDWSGLTFDAQALYRWTAKTDFSLSIYGRNEESNSALAQNMEVFGATFGYKQQFTDKLGATLYFIYEHINYDQAFETDRIDNRYYLKPDLRYQVRDWLRIDLRYLFDMRDSTDNLFDYTSNTVILGLKIQL